jgi:imidazolonepropionase-like amidohydrolase
LARGVQDTTVLRNGTIVDVERGTLRPAYDVLLSQGRIVDLRPTGTPLGPSVAVIDLSGRFLLPGLIDTHAHVTVLRWSRDTTGGLSSRYDRVVSEATLRLLVEHGVTVARNPGAPTAEGLRLRADVAAGRIVGPRLLTAGVGLTGRTMEEMREQVRSQARAGVDYIKIGPASAPPLVFAAIAEARRLGVRSMGHLQRTTWSAAARQGIDAITHGVPWAPEYLPARYRNLYRQTLRGRLDWLEWVDVDGPEIDAMIAGLVDHRVHVDPTLIAYHTDFWADDAVYRQSAHNELAPDIAADWAIAGFTDDFSAADFARGKRLWPKILRLIRRYHDAGVLLTTGSDLPNPWVVPGISLHQEMRLLGSAGIPNIDVLRMATLNGARALGIDRDHGTIAMGKVADIVVLRANPLADLRNSTAIDMVFLRGKPIMPR